MLIRAEANEWLGNRMDAVADFQAVRDRSIDGVTCLLSSDIITGDQENFIKNVRDEYYREMAFEGVFLHEVRRRNALDKERGVAEYRGEAFNDPQNSIRLANDVKWNDYRLIAPIPDAEVFANTDIRQTPGY